MRKAEGRADNAEGQARVAVQIGLRWSGGDVKRFGLAPDALFAYANAELRPLSQATRTIPIVFVGASAPIEDGYVASFVRPGGNITGFTQYEPSASTGRPTRQRGPEFKPLPAS